MKEFALREAGSRFERAKAAFYRMQAATTHNEREAHWSDFLMMANGIYPKLEEGAKGCGKCEAWFGRKVRVRKKDELLRYLHHARNTDEHTIDGTTYQTFEFVIGADCQAVGIRFDEAGHIVPVQVGSDPGTVRGVTTAKPVTDKRFNDTFEPPKIHLGRPIENAEDITVLAQLGLTYVCDMLNEACTLPRRP
jgi:hypothetical protein